MRITFSTEPIYTASETRRYMKLVGAFEYERASYKIAPKVETAEQLLHIIGLVRTIPTSLRNRTSARDEMLSELEAECASCLQSQETR